MSVSQGREFLSIPGPTNVPDEVLAAMHRPAIDIYSGEMIGITDSCLADLARIFRTKGRTYIYAANGHGGWEAALTNVLSRGDLVLALESGRFATGWGEMASMLGVEVELGLLRVIPDEYLRHAHHWLILHGRYICQARKPKCDACIVCDLCSSQDKWFDCGRPATTAKGKTQT